MSKKTSRFGSNVTADVERRKREGSSYGYLKLPQNVNVFKESAGKLKLDIIPYIVTDEHHMDGNPKYPDSANPGNPWYKKPILVHRGVGAGNESIVCPKTQGKKCPVCEQRAKQQSQGVEKDDLIPKAQLRNLYVVIPIGHKEYEEKFHIWDISNGNFQKKLDEELSENPEVGIFPDPSDGKTLQVRFSEETFNKNKYYEATRIDFEDREEAYEEVIMEQAPNLDEVITILTYKEIEKMFLEIDDEGEEEQDDSPKVSFKKKKAAEEEEKEQPARKRKTVEEDSHPFRKKKTITQETEEEEEEEEEEAEEEEPSEPEAPVRRKRVEPEAEAPVRRKKVAEPEEEEEEEETKKPQSTGLRKKTVPSSNGKDACPVGHEFGEDWDGYDDCDDCKVFAACGKAHSKK